MEKRYICFVCYKHHPERRGVSEQEFKAGNAVCREEKCFREGKPLEPAFLCSECRAMVPFQKNPHEHRRTSTAQEVKE